ncbi:MAG: hypothetical protein C4530_09255 [Desulfobacteraceae bacterium]|nr:MAG: hypothetical protein C4530_09255 [Desulfobacteraceae bacterium]
MRVWNKSGKSFGFGSASVLLIAVFLFACAPKPVKPPAPPAIDTGDRLFETAERLYQSKNYDKALESYTAYYRSYPKRPLAAAALLKIGEIHTIDGKTELAREFLNRLIAEYPDSPFILDARIAVLATFYREGDYQQAIRAADGLPLDRLSDRQAVSLNSLLAEASIGLEAFSDAFYFFALALERAAEHEKPSLRNSLEDVLQRLDSIEMAALLDRIGNIEARALLLYQLAENRASEEMYEESIRLLTELTETFPGHALAPNAATRIDELKIKLLYGIEKGLYGRYSIGCLLPLSGPYALYGNRAFKGIELALNIFSSTPSNPSFNLIVKDTRSDPDRTQEAVAELHAENVAAILGPIAAAVPAAFEAQDRKIPILTWTQEDHIPLIGDYVFRNFITPKMQVDSLVEYAMGNLGYLRFAVLYPDEPYGTTYMNLFWDAVVAKGGQIVGAEAYDPGQTDFAEPIKKLAGLYYEVPEDLKPKPLPFEGVETKDGAGGPQVPKPIVDFDAVFIPDAPKKAGLVIPQLAYYDIVDVCLMGTNLWNSENLIQMAGQYAQGALIADGFFLDSNSEAIRSFARKFEEIYGEKPGFIEAIAYDTAMLVFEALGRPGIDSRPALRDELLKTRGYPGLTGLTSFDESGDCQKRLYLLRLKGNRFVEVESSR